MNTKAWVLGAILIAAAATWSWADGTPAWRRDNQLSLGFALGKGFVDRSDSEIFAVQSRIEYRRKKIYVACRGSWVAQECNSRPNPKEIALLAGLSLPGFSPRDRFQLGVGVGATDLYGGVLSLPLEVRVKLGILALIAFSNINNAHSFHGLCLGLDIPFRVFKK